MDDSTFNAGLTQAAGFLQQGNLDHAEPILRSLLADRPGDPYALQLSGILSMKLDRLAEAEDFFRRAVAAKEDYVEAHNNLGIVLRSQGKFFESIAAYQRALGLRPGDENILNNLGNALHAAGEGPKAVLAFRQALATRETDEAVWNSLGLSLLAQSDAAGAAAAFARAGNILPLPIFQSNRLFALHFDPAAQPESIFAEHLEFDRQFAQPLRSHIRLHENDRDPHRRLRVGYVSPDFRRHSAAFFIEPLLANHDPAATEIFLYGNAAKEDDLTDRLRSYPLHWRDIFKLDDDAAADLVRADRIDILVELAGHTEGSRLLLFARKPAPVQITYLGYPDTTGLSAIDYRLSDAYLDPPGAERFYSEKLVRLPRTFAAYRPPDDAPEVSVSPASVTGTVTFASFNSFSKVNPGVLDCWARILSQVPGSVFLIAAHGTQSVEARQRITSIFQNRGVAPDRLRAYERQPWPEYLALHRQADILLDTFPVGGHTVTCHALWLGLPVVTLAGKICCQRLSTSVLSNLNLQSLIAQTPEQYIQIAVELARDLPRLSALRINLRQMMRQSPLLDGRQFARDVESAYRKMWETFCRGESPQAQ
jgi:predicted O-linked N-acetylglucosamine transferase (SPINDLY family)